MKRIKISFILLIVAISNLAGCSNSSGSSQMRSGIHSVGIMGGTLIQRMLSERSNEVMLLNLKNNNVCSGAIIFKNAILTAAHCVTKNEKNILVFFDDKPFAEDSQSQGVVASAVEIHPQYLAGTELQSVDLALVFISSELPLTHAPVPISAEEVQPGQNIMMAGYGKTLQGDSHQVGLLYHAEGSVKASGHSFFSVDQQAGVGICDGDSGGPAYITTNNQRAVVGVAKMVYSENNESEGECSAIAQFTAVTTLEIRNWLYQTIQQMQK